MEIQEYETKTYKLTDLDRLDPITVFVKSVPRDDSDSFYGELTVRCWDKAWHSSFGAMGRETVEAFVAECDEYYLQKNLKHYGRVFDFDSIEKEMDLCLSNDFELGLNFKEVCDFYGNPYENDDAIPTKTSSDQEYLLRICRAVIAAMKQVTHTRAGDSDEQR